MRAVQRIALESFGSVPHNGNDSTIGGVAPSWCAQSQRLTQAAQDVAAGPLYAAEFAAPPLGAR